MSNPLAIVTGGSRGIGRGIALKLAELGYDLIVNFVGNQSCAQDTAMSCKAIGMGMDRNLRADIFQADISLTKDRQRLISFAQSQFGRLDMLVNNAGIAPDL